MGVFKDEKEVKRVIFNVEMGLAERLEKAKELSRELGKKLDVDTAIDKALEKFLKKAEKKLADMHPEGEAIVLGEGVRLDVTDAAGDAGEAADSDAAKKKALQVKEEGAIEVKKETPPAKTGAVAAKKSAPAASGKTEKKETTAAAV